MGWGVGVSVDLQCLLGGPPHGPMKDTELGC